MDSAGKDSPVPLMHNDPSDLGFICVVKKRKTRFRIKESNRGFSLKKNVP